MTLPVRHFMRARNRAKILNGIRMADVISRSDISRNTGLSRASVTGLTADLIREGLIFEKKAGAYKGGRRPMLLALNPDGAYVVGVNLSVRKLTSVILNFKADVLASHTEPLDAQNYTIEAIANCLMRAVQTCIWEANFSRSQISGVGIGLPGLVDSQTGRVRFMPNYEWNNVNLRDLVQQSLNRPTFIDNNANTLAIAEQWFGTGRGVGNFLVLALGNGVGLGCVVNGRIGRGHTGSAGEIGHITIKPDGRPCRCGKKGCLEAYVGNIAIQRQAQMAIQDGIWQPEPSQPATYDSVVAAARNGVPVLREIFKKAGQILGMGIAHLITLYNPERIVITGKGVQAGGMLFNSMHAIIPTLLSSKLGQLDTEILIQDWDEQNWARGAGSLVLQEIYKSPVDLMGAAN